MTHPQDSALTNPAQVTDAMVEAALNSWFDGEIPVSFSGDFRADMRAALTAAIGAGGQEVAVKPLVWFKPDQRNTLSRAENDFGVYRTWTHFEANGRWFWSLDGYEKASGECASEDDAKAAAQAHYERRILSAIAHPVQPVWRGIESAPKDGTEILVCGPAKEGGAYLDVQRWPKNWSSKWPVSYMAYVAGEPTHWMPLPAAPQPKGD